MSSSGRPLARSRLVASHIQPFTRADHGALQDLPMAVFHQGKVDVHHHVRPPVLRSAPETSNGEVGGWYFLEETLKNDRTLSNEIGISTAFLSFVAPAADIERKPQKARQWARACNEYCANVKKNDPSHYGFFATVPSLLDTKAALEELRHAFDLLNADGVTLFTRYGTDNHYLGHKDFLPVWDFLNERKAVVFVHPTGPCNATQRANEHIPFPAYDICHETGRTAIDLIASNVLRDHVRDCKIILSHAGGTMPYILDRAAGLLPHERAFASKPRGEYREDAQKFYFDTALSTSSVQMAGLRELLKNGAEDHLLFGSDLPNAPRQAIREYTAQLDSSTLVDAKALSGNAAKLFPRLRST